MNTLSFYETKQFAANSAKTSSTRRRFLKTGTAVSAAAMNVSLVNAATSTSATTELTQNNGDLSCYKLGLSIGEQLAHQVGTSAQPLQLHYVDAADTSVDSLRLGIVDGIRQYSGASPMWTETQAYRVGILGELSLVNATTGVSISAQIPTVALSHLELNRSTRVAIEFITTKLI
jgi:hypothetical protein